MFLCICPNMFLYVLLCTFVHLTRCGYCRRRFFFRGKGRSRIWGHVQIAKYVFFKYYKHFPRCGYCRRRFFFREKGRSRILGTCHIGENTVFQLFCVSGALWVTFGVPLAPFGVALAPFGMPLGSLWGAIGLPLGCPWLALGNPWLALGALASLWVPLGSFWELNVHRLRCLSTKSSLLEHATAAEVVSRTRLGAHLPHAPGARMTVVTQTPSK